MVDPFPTNAPLQLVLVGGLPGSGKTEAAAVLDGLCDWRHLDKDDLTRERTEAQLIAAGGDPDDRDSPLYVEQVRPQEYAYLLQVGFEFLTAGRSVILDAPFLAEVTDEAWLSDVRSRAAALGAELSVIWVHADLPAMRERLISRRATRDAYKLEHWDSWCERVAAHPGPVRSAVTVYDVHNNGGQEPYLANQMITVAHTITHTLPTREVEAAQPAKRRWLHR